MKRLHHCKLPLRMLSAVASASLLPWVSPALAQAPGQKAANRFAIDEVIVTARRVEESLQDTPLAVTVLTGEELLDRGALDITDVADFAPNTRVQKGGTASGLSAIPSVYIRGIGGRDFLITNDPAVGIYVDGVYLGRSVGSLLDLLDMERVEVLRGPQGTLFGRNSIGGALNLVPVRPDPSEDISGYARVSAGERGFSLLQGSVNVPLSDAAAARFSVFNRQRDGFIRAAQYDDLKLGEEDVWGLRTSLRLLPSDSLTIDIAADYSERSDTPPPRLLQAAGNVSEPGLPAFDNNESSISALRFNRNIPSRPPIPGAFDAPLAPNCTPDVRDTTQQCFGNAWVTGTDNSVWVDAGGNMITPDQKLDVYGGAINIVWDTAWGNVTSITSYRGFDSSFTNDQDGTPYIIWANNHDEYKQDQFSQELQLVGQALENRVDWILGAYYFEEDGLERLSLLAPMLPPAAASSELPLYQIIDREIENSTTAAYGQLVYHIAENLHLTAGLRYTEEEKLVDFTQFRPRAAGPSTDSASGEQKVSEWNSLINLSWDINDDAMLYGQFSDGFRSGGFPARFPNGLVTPLPDYDPEYVEAFEIGLKSSWLDGSLRLNVAAFLTTYEGLQIAANSTDPALQFSAATTNLGDATMQGLEIEANYLLFDNLRIDATVGYLDASIDELVGGSLATGTGNLGVVITEANELPFTPEWTLSLGMNHSMFFDNGAELRSRIDYSWVDDQYYDLTNYERTFEEAYGKLNANISYVFAGGNSNLTLGGRNLTDEDYAIDRRVVLGSSSAWETLVRPRELYLQFEYRFGAQ